MASSVTEAPGLPAPRSQRRGRAVSALPLQVGFVTTFLTVVVLLPIAAVVWKSTGGGWSGFWEVVSAPQAVAAFKLTLITSTLAVLTTAAELRPRVLHRHASLRLLEVDDGGDGYQHD